MSYITEATPRRTIQASVVRITFGIDGIDSASNYWNIAKTRLNLADGLGDNSSADNGTGSIVCMGSMFTANQTTPAEPQHVIGAQKPIDNPIMAWDGNASLRTLVSTDPRLATLLHLMGNTAEAFLGASGSDVDWEEWSVNWRGCTVTVADKLSGNVLFSLKKCKVTAENIAIQARAIVARDVQFNHLGNW